MVVHSNFFFYEKKSAKPQGKKLHLHLDPNISQNIECHLTNVNKDPINYPI